MKKRITLNTIFSILQQVIAIICGFILPRMILISFGSEVNGVVSSISQFFVFISFLDLGVGAVVQSSLYEPLLHNNKDSIDAIITSASVYFRRIAYVIVLYAIVLVFVYPKMIQDKYDFVFLAVLTIAIGANYFTQFYYGIVDRIVLISSQQGYIYSASQIAVTLVTTIIGSIIIYDGGTVQSVKIIAAGIFVIRALLVRKYVDIHYKINRKASYHDEPIKQKWYGMAQHIAAVILDGTDNIVLTVFSSLSNVSIYAVYNMILSAIKSVIIASISGIQAAFGELYALNDKDKLLSNFSLLEWGIHTVTILVFCCTALLIIPFVAIYTSGVGDANYVQPLFAIMIVIANGLHCLRLPYNIMVLAAGHYKQTQKCYVIAAFSNIIISIIAVFNYGLVGVTIGTAVALAYQLLWLIVYNHNHLVEWPFLKTIKQFWVDLVEIIVVTIFSGKLVFAGNNYIEWILYACYVSIIVLVVIVVFNCLIYRKNIIKTYRYLTSYGEKD